jgi:hypothetical protein
VWKGLSLEGSMAWRTRNPGNYRRLRGC